MCKASISEAAAGSWDLRVLGGSRATLKHRGDSNGQGSPPSPLTTELGWPKLEEIACCLHRHHPVDPRPAGMVIWVGGLGVPIADKAD